MSQVFWYFFCLKGSNWAPYEQTKTVSRTFSFLQRYSNFKFENVGAIWSERVGLIGQRGWGSLVREGGDNFLEKGGANWLERVGLIG